MAHQESLLDGYRVLDLTDEKGLFCGRILGDFGADVIKVERPGGDATRNTPPFYKDSAHPERSLFWFYTNLNKRGITLNIESEDGRQIFRRLVETAHFVIESFEPGYMDSLGLGYAVLEEINPSVIMTSITPFGQSGPYAQFKATDLTSVAMGGMMRLYGDPDRAPVRITEPQAFFQGGSQGAVGSMLAHYHRELTGEGQWVDVSIQEAIALTLMVTVEFWDIAKVNYRGRGSSSIYPRPIGPLVQKRVFHCRDGLVYFMLGGGAQPGMIASSKAIVEAANQEGMLLELKDYDWALYDVMSITQEEYDRLVDMIEGFLMTKSKAELITLAVEKGILLVPAWTTKEVTESPQLEAREYWVKVEHPEVGDVLTYPGAPVRLSECPWRVYRRAPLVGEHNDEVYVGELGFSLRELALLKSRGIV